MIDGLNTDTISMDGVVEIPQCGLYVMKEGALDPLFAKLRSMGYEIKKATEEDDKLPGHRAWFASLDISKGKCDLCGKYIPVAGIYSEGKKCPECGGLIYAEYVKDAILKFTFVKDPAGRVDPILMRVVKFDQDNGILHLHPDPVDPGHRVGLTDMDALECLERNKDEYTIDEQSKCILIKFEPHKVGVINLHDVDRGDNCVRAAHVVKIWEGKEYGEWDRLPVENTHMIYEAWGWAPLLASPKLHERIIHAAGMVSRCDYYYQDGRWAFSPIHILRMGRFVRNLTKLDADKWDSMVDRADLSGPGFIRAAANFCSDKPEISNNPNMWNVLDMFCGSQHQVTNDMVDSIKLTMSDPEERKKVEDLLSAVGKSNRKGMVITDVNLDEALEGQNE